MKIFSSLLTRTIFNACPYLLFFQFIETKNELETLIDNLREKCSVWDPELPVIYGITPTYARPVQKAELTR